MSLLKKGSHVGRVENLVLLHAKFGFLNKMSKPIEDANGEWVKKGRLYVTKNPIFRKFTHLPKTNFETW